MNTDLNQNVDAEIDVEKERKKVKIIFICRICMWLIAAGSTLYWMYWSFHLYTLGYMDEHVYATALRPIFAKGLFISLIAICVSFLLRKWSDETRKKYDPDFKIDKENIWG